MDLALADLLGKESGINLPVVLCKWNALGADLGWRRKPGAKEMNEWVDEWMNGRVESNF